MTRRFVVPLENPGSVLRRGIANFATGFKELASAVGGGAGKPDMVDAGLRNIQTEQQVQIEREVEYEEFSFCSE